MRMIVLAAALVVAGCTAYPPDYGNNGPYYGGTSTSPTPVPTSGQDIIEYRVTGTPSSVLVRYSNSTDGLAQITTTLPFSIAVRFNQSSMFLSLEAAPITTPYSVNYPFLSVQIVVNGTLFREATSSNLSQVLSVNGTWRR